MKDLAQDITAAVIEGAADYVHSLASKPTYPEDHKAGMRVPKGGSSCQSCEYLAGDGKECSNEYFQKWNGSNKLPAPADEYCSDWYEPEKEIKAGGPGSGRHKGQWTNGEEDLNSKYKYSSVKEVPINSISGDPRQMDLPQAYNQDKVSSYARMLKRGKDMDAILVSDLGNDKYKIRDGHHRWLAAKQIGLKTIGIQSFIGEVKAATEASLAGDQKGSLWKGMKIIGFTAPEEEGLRAMLSRIPPELFTGINEIKSAKELNAKHGKYIPEEKVMLFNPSNFSLRQRFGKGDGWIYHAEMTVIHEVGHAIYESFDQVQKEAWMKLGGWRIGWIEGQSPAYNEARPGWPKDVSQWTHKAGIRVPRHYSERNPNECFADCFAFYLLGKAHQMEPSMKRFMDQLLQDRVKQYPSASVESPSKPYTETIQKPVPV